MMSEVLHIKHRPQQFADVVGQAAMVSSLARMIDRDGAHAFLFAGPSGTGKTTLARIAALELGCAANEILEIDAATHTGVDGMRGVQETLQYRPFGKSPTRCIIVDEAHGLSKQAWQSLLKSVEEPPPHVYWFFCTTEPGKVPATIKTRCAAFTLKPVADKELGVLFDRVCKAEKIDLPGDIGDLIIKEALGSPRQMLVNLALCVGVKNKKAAADILRTALASDPTLELCRFLVKGGGSWGKAMAILGQMDGQEPESVRIVVSNYMAAVAKGARSDRDACSALSVLEAFSTPYNSSDKLAPLIISIGRVLLAG